MTIRMRLPGPTTPVPPEPGSPGVKQHEDWHPGRKKGDRLSSPWAGRARDLVSEQALDAGQYGRGRKGSSSNYVQNWKCVYGVPPGWEGTEKLGNLPMGQLLPAAGSAVPTSSCCTPSREELGPQGSVGFLPLPAREEPCHPCVECVWLSLSHQGCTRGLRST